VVLLNYGDEDDWERPTAMANVNQNRGENGHDAYTQQILDGCTGLLQKVIRLKMSKGM